MAQTVRGNAGRGRGSVSRGPRFARPEISWGEFAKLRLSQFIPAAEIRALRDWEFMNLRWVGEAVGFTEWLRRKDDPKVLRSIALDLDALDASVVDTVLECLKLPLRAGMTRKRLVRLLGEPTNVLVLPKAGDRETLIYDAARSAGSYRLSCTAKKVGGLAYLVVMRGDWAAPEPSRSTPSKKRRTSASPATYARARGR